MTEFDQFRYGKVPGASIETACHIMRLGSALPGDPGTSGRSPLPRA
jgi:hypothetical protein